MELLAEPDDKSGLIITYIDVTASSTKFGIQLQCPHYFALCLDPNFGDHYCVNYIAESKLSGFPLIYIFHVPLIN